MAIKRIRLIEDVSDMFDKNIDPDVLRDRMRQAARARDLAIEAAGEAEQTGNTALASRLRQDAEELQQIIDLTTQNSNILNNNTSSQQNGDSSATNDQGRSNSDSTEASELDDPADSEDDDLDEPDDSEDSDESEDDQIEGDEENSTSDVDGIEDLEDEDSETEDSNSDNNDSSTTDDIDTDNTTEDEDSDGGSNEDSEESDGSDESGESDNSDDSEDEYDESDAYGEPKVEDDTVLQDPFKNDQIDMPLPKKIEDAIRDGSLKIEPEIDAIIRIISKLKGEPRRGAEQALKDYFNSIDPYGDLYEEDN